MVLCSCFTLAAATGAAQAAPSVPFERTYEGSRAEGPLVPATGDRARESAPRAYYGGKFQVQQAGCWAYGRIEAFPPSKYQVNSWYYGSPSRYSEKIWWRPLLYKYSGGQWRYQRAGVWSWGYVNIVGMLPSAYDAYGQPLYWRTGTGITRFIPFTGLTAGSYAVQQQAYWERPKRTKSRWTPFYGLNSTICRYY